MTNENELARPLEGGPDIQQTQQGKPDDYTGYSQYDDYVVLDPATDREHPDYGFWMDR